MKKAIPARAASWVMCLLALALLQSACGGADSPSAPSAETADISLSGVFSGSGSDSSGPGQMTWTISQSRTTVSGPFVAKTKFGSVTFTGTASGSLSGTTLTFTVTVPTGGVTGLPTCTIAMNGTATGVTSARISGTYSGTNSCTGTFTGGQFTLDKQ
jgi:hypothetical protein